MSLDHPHAIIVRKRKRNTQFQYSSNLILKNIQASDGKSPRSRSNSTNSIALSSPKNKPQHNKDWTTNSKEKDATSDETGNIIRFLSDFTSNIFKKSYNLAKGKLQKKSNESIDQEELITGSTKKRRVDVAQIDKKLVPKTPLREALLDKNFLPELDSTKKDIDFVKSPIDWTLEETLKEDEQKGNSNTSEKDYGTKFIRRSTKKHKDPNVEAVYLRSVYKGQYKPPTPRSDAPPTPNSKTYDKTLTGIQKITETLRKNWKSSSNDKANHRNDDIIFLKEVKLPPATPSRFSLSFDTTKLTFEKEFKFYQKILNERKLLQERIHKEKLEATKPVSTAFKRLSKEEENDVINVWKSRGKDSRVLLTAHNIDVKVMDFKTLADKQWLNDVVIELYLKTLNSKTIYTFNSYFFTTLEERGYKGVQKWMKRAKVLIKDLEVIIAPINVHQTHWVLGVINLKSKEILYFDSLATRKNHFSERALDLLNEFVKGETTKQGNPELGTGFKLTHILNCPQQQNGYDCGVFTLLNALYISKHLDLTYQPQDATQFRKVIAHTILKLSK